MRRTASSLAAVSTFSLARGPESGAPGHHGYPHRRLPLPSSVVQARHKHRYKVRRVHISSTHTTQAPRMHARAVCSPSSQWRTRCSAVPSRRRKSTRPPTPAPSPPAVNAAGAEETTARRHTRATPRPQVGEYAGPLQVVSATTAASITFCCASSRAWRSARNLAFSFSARAASASTTRFNCSSSSREKLCACVAVSPRAHARTRAGQQRPGT